MDYRKKYLKYKKKYLTTKKLIVNKVLDQLQKKNTNSKNKLLGGMDTGSIIGIIVAIISILLGMGWYSMSQDKYKRLDNAEFLDVEEYKPQNKVSEPENLVFEELNKDYPQEGNAGETTYIYGERNKAEDFEKASLGGNGKI